MCKVAGHKAGTSEHVPEGCVPGGGGQRQCRDNIHGASVHGGGGSCGKRVPITSQRAPRKGCAHGWRGGCTQPWTVGWTHEEACKLGGGGGRMCAWRGVGGGKYVHHPVQDMCMSV